MATSPEDLLISSILRDKDFVVAVQRGISNEMFHARKDEWKWLEDYYSKHRRTPSKGAFKDKFPDFAVKAVNDTEHFVDGVRKMHTRIALVSSMRDVSDLVAEGDIDQAVQMMAKSMVNVSASIGGVQDYDIINDWEHIYNEVALRKERFEEDGMAGIPTGFDTFDERTGGLQGGQLIVVGARPGEGKTWTLMRMATTGISAGYNVHFSALEMSRAEVGMRIHNFLSKDVGKTIFKSLALAQGRDFELANYREFLRQLKDQTEAKFTVSDTRKIGAMEIASQIERHRPDIYFLDYLTLAKTGAVGDWQDIGRFSKDLKILAGDYNIPIVTASQLNRTNGIGKQAVGTEALSGADAIGQDADCVITMKKKSERVIEYNLAKYRHGTSDYKWYAHMEMAKGIFKEVSYNKAIDLEQQDEDRRLAEAEES
ncbi:dsDNA helicase [Brevibacterium phage Cantare]|uniref:DsDNA helicase n=1 Tax=Brevibacterium phage Cantare TaxID=2338395 RepID=A0A3G3LYS6_9CAUD|nr:DnaB-like replicative helicase [Brevibacterium phage Cantare]AYQ99266.1 dsDNA helicase [Brevibacterium phage Cantare]